MSPDAAQACAMGWMAFLTIAVYSLSMVWGSQWSFLHKFFLIILMSSLGGILVAMLSFWFEMSIGGQ